MPISTLVAALALVAPNQRIYFVGNNVTDTLGYAAVEGMASVRGEKLIFGRHTIPNATLSWILGNADSGFRENYQGAEGNRQGLTEALPNYDWDSIVLQPFERSVDADVEAIRQIVSLSQLKGANTGAHWYLFSRWPQGGTRQDFDYQAQWDRQQNEDGQVPPDSREYLHQVVTAVNKDRGANRFHVIPVGDVLYDLDRKLKAKPIGGFSSVKDFYLDGIHMKPAGRFVVGTIVYATLFRRDPRGLPSDRYAEFDPEFVRFVQHNVWHLVRKHKLAGVNMA